MRIKNNFLWLFLVMLFYTSSTFLFSSCGQIGMPTGGIRDSISPVLIKASPEQNSTSFNANKVTLTFDEYIEVQDIQKNVLISPYQKKNPAINYNLKTITVKFKDSLLPNTTYSIDFGNAIKDVNEGNVFKNFTYVFSTGAFIDSFTLKGKVEMAETGIIDSTLIVLLYRQAVDSSVRKNKPDYITRLQTDGSFTFNNLPAANFKIYALKDEDGSKNYSRLNEAFAFADGNKDILIGANNPDINLFAYQAEKEKDFKPKGKTVFEKKLKYSINQVSYQQELTAPLLLTFNNPLQEVDFSKIVLTDTFFTVQPQAKLMLDSTRKEISLSNTWPAGKPFYLLIDKDAFTDSADNKLAKTDSIFFTVKEVEAYGNLTLHFKNLDTSLLPRLILLQGEKIMLSEPIRSNTITKNLLSPGEYEIRILLDANNNGLWDKGDYETFRQPEKTINFPKKLIIKANWDNEQDVDLK